MSSPHSRSSSTSSHRRSGSESDMDQDIDRPPSPRNRSASYSPGSHRSVPTPTWDPLSQPPSAESRRSVSTPPYDPLSPPPPGWIPPNDQDDGSPESAGSVPTPAYDPLSPPDDDGYSDRHVCPECAAEFDYPRNLARHWRQKHSGQPTWKREPKKPLMEKRFACPQCSFSSAYKRALVRHIRNRHAAGTSGMTSGGLRRGPRKPASASIDTPASDGASASPTPTKRGRRAAFQWKPSIKQHLNLPPIDPIDIPSKAVLRDHGYDEEVIDLMRENGGVIWRQCRTNYRTDSDFLRSYNLRFESTEPGQQANVIKDFVRAIHQQTDYSYKINIGLGYIMRKRPDKEGDVDDGEPNDDDQWEEIRYWYPSSGSSSYLLFGQRGAQLVRSEEDLHNRVNESIRDDDIIEFLKNNRPNTKWIVTDVLNVRVYHYVLHGHTVLGQPDQAPPSFVHDSRYLISLYTNPSTGRPYDDYRCIFRAVARADIRCFRAQDGAIRREGLETKTSQLFDEYRRKFDVDVANFRGLRLAKMHQVEVTTKHRIWIYHLQSDESNQVRARPLYKSRAGLPTKWPRVNIGVWENGRGSIRHASLITKLSSLVKSYACDRCSMVFLDSNTFRKHQRTVVCHKSVKDEIKANKPPGGAYKPPSDIFDDLYRAGVHDIRKEERVKRSFSIFDFESYSAELNLVAGKTQVYEESLVPLCVSISTQCVRGFSEIDGVVLIERHDPNLLVQRMVDHMLEVSAASYEQSRPRYQYLFDQLHSLAANPIIDIKLREYYETLEKRLDDFIRDFAIFGFNSSRFDLNLCRRYLIPYLKQVDGLEKGGGLRIIKRGNAYLKLQSRSLKFLDISSFLGPGSLDRWLKAFGVENGKFVYPHNFMKQGSLDAQLNQSYLPPISVFTNDLTGEPLPQSTYDMIERTWIERGWNNMEDYLLFYCKQDTAPVREMVTKIIDFWQDAVVGHPVNLMGSVSLPALATHFFKNVLNCHTFIGLANSASIDFYEKLRDQIVGGASIIWTRKHIAGETKLRAHKPEYNSETCQSCLGLDANALYLHCLGGEGIVHATGIPIEWKRGNDPGKFSRRYMLPNHVSVGEIEYLIWMGHVYQSDGDLNHYLNGGQLRILPRRYTYDGVIYGQRKKCFNFYGYSKIHMLSLYYQFLDRFFDRRHWELILTDTDSCYLGISRSSWAEFERDCVKPGLEMDYINERSLFLPRTDTPELAAYDARRLGVFKVVSPRDHFLFTPLLTSTTVGTLEFRSIIEPIRNTDFRNSQDFHTANAIAWDPPNQTVRCRSVLKPDVEYDLPYEKLVIGVGMLPNSFGIKGVHEHAFFLKEVSDARRIRNQLLRNFELSLESGVSDEERKRLLHIAIVGGGPTGVEFGAELYDFVEQDVTRVYKERKADVRVTLIEGRQILGMFDERLRRYAEKKIGERKNFQLLNAMVAEVRADGVALSDGKFLPCGLVVWSTGLAPREFTKSLPNEWKNKHGQILVDNHLRVIADESKNSYSLGDCAICAEAPLPATAQVAERQGRYLAKALNQEMKTGTKPELPFKHQSMGMLAYIGGYRALSDLPEFKLKGIISWFLWRSAYLTRLGSWRLRMQVPLDWLKTLMFGRDTSRFD